MRTDLVLNIVDINGDFNLVIRPVQPIGRKKPQIINIDRVIIFQIIKSIVAVLFGLS